MRVRQLGDPILREISAPVSPSEVSAPKTQAAITKMKEILDGVKAISDENGNAIAAPQIGFPFRMILLRLAGEFVVMINPVLTKLSNDIFEFEEECFSVYNLRGKVSRHSDFLSVWQK